jgi:MFS family permease
MLLGARATSLRNPGVPVGVVAALGLTQIIGYGTLYYSFSILAPGMATDLGISVAQVFAIFSASLFVGGLSAPYIGRQMDGVGASTVMAIGSVLSALTLILCAWSPSVAIFALAIVLLEISSGMVQYQAAFAALVEADPRSASRSITYLTLIAGFASTIFWPIATALLGYLSWREIYLVYAVLNLVVCMPFHVWIMRKGKVAAAGGLRPMREPVVGAIPRERRRSAVIIVSAAFALISFTLGAMLAHMVPMLGSLGFGSAAVVIGSLFGPAQVLSRLINMIFGTRLAPPGLAVLSAVFMVLSVVILALSGNWLPGAVAFSLVPALGAVHDPDHGQHDRNLDQHADDGGECCAGLEAEQADGGGNRQLEEIARADQGGGPGNTMLLAGKAVEDIGQPGIEIDLDQDRHGQQGR